MPSAPPPPGVAEVVTQWTVQPLAFAVVAVLAVAYAAGVVALRHRGIRWSAGRTATFALGLLLVVWTSAGFPQVYGRTLFWVWLAQVLALWVFVPLVIMWGHPVQLARAVQGPGGRVDRVLHSRPARVVSNPLIAPALVPALSFVFFFGPLPGWAVGVPPAGWVLQIVLLMIGALMVTPLVGLDEEASSLAVGFSLLIGSFELVIDALPGIVLRLQSHVTTDYFTYAVHRSWSMTPIADQRLAGNILWTFAELIDLPFLILVFRRWLRADARDAARVDAVLEAERWARRGALTPDDDRVGTSGESDGASEDAAPDRDVPWWLSDPAMQQRLRRNP